MEWFIGFFLFVCGACVGSFMNVLIFRFGFSERASKRSRCMACDAEIPWYDLFPLVSYAALRGRCRFCGSALSVQYPLVECVTGMLFFLAYLTMPPAVSFWDLCAFGALLAFLSVLVVLVVYDIRHTLAPLPFIGVLLSAALLATFSQSFAGHSMTPLRDSLAGGAILYGFFMAIVLLTRGRGMGAGDAYIAGAMGIMLGLFRGIEAVAIGVWVATIISLLGLLLSVRKGEKRLFPFSPQVTMKTELPLIPFLAFGFAVALYTNFSPLAATASLMNVLFPTF